MMDTATACFFKRYYPHVIKWWLVVYNPEVFRVWPSEAEKEETLRIEAEEAALAPPSDFSGHDTECIDESAFNATTGSYSGLYGQKPVDADTQAALDAIMNKSSSQNSIDFLLAGNADPPTSSPSDIIIPEDQDEIIREANEIYARLLREAAEDEAKKQAEIDEMRRIAAEQFAH